MSCTNLFRQPGVNFCIEFILDLLTFDIHVPLVFEAIRFNKLITSYTKPFSEIAFFCLICSDVWWGMLYKDGCN